ncbi:hypothetical protein [Sphingobacterium sp. DR205]|uniref:hypothetical protein n=1 Tax=Sphingobacterium sp. DR205 TaxID=2713573 RepID=UPI0013E45B19|nr:hypothetical protein [Sphingobacterium sp. DR205]QIH36601.1 hypothetical protein G6053_28765 [Sphingobacterium sp. DR205]
MILRDSIAIASGQRWDWSDCSSTLVCLVADELSKQPRPNVEAIPKQPRSWCEAGAERTRVLLAFERTLGDFKGVEGALLR